MMRRICLAISPVTRSDALYPNLIRTRQSANTGCKYLLDFWPPKRYFQVSPCREEVYVSATAARFGSPEYCVDSFAKQGASKLLGYCTLSANAARRFRPPDILGILFNFWRSDRGVLL